MAGVNKVILIGNLGRDPEMRHFQDGTAVANFSIATSDEWKDKDTGEKKSKTEWHRIVVFRQLAEICGKYLTKGKQVYIEGKLQTRSWEKDGVTRYVTEVVANEMKMLGSRDGSESYSSAGNSSSGGQSDPGQQEPFPEMDGDDIPFGVFYNT